MFRAPPGSTRTSPLFPYTTPFRSQPAAQGHPLALERAVGDVEGDLLAAVAFERDAPFAAVAESDLDAVAAVGPAQGAGPRAVGGAREPPGATVEDRKSGV